MESQVLPLSFLSLFSLSWLGRLLLILYGVWHDSRQELQYTDIDYWVFSDASLHVKEGGSPYERDTYRYTPLLAWLLLPNHILSIHYGKVLFITLDVLVAWCIERVLAMEGVSDRKRFFSCLIWLLNPVTAVVSSRGNAESLLALIMLSSLYMFVRGRVLLSGVLYGLAVHFKFYPIIHCLVFYLAVDRTPWSRARDVSEISNVHGTPREKSHKRGRRFKINSSFSEKDLRRNKISNVAKTSNLSPSEISSNDKTSWLGAWNVSKFSIHWGSLLSVKRLKFILVSSGTFVILGLLCYKLYGWDFVEETYLYHLKRTDIKHNFSLYFYMLFVTQGTWLASLLSKIAFIPQFILLLTSSLWIHRDISFCLFIQTFVFVTFNKVVTSQVWPSFFLSLLPLLYFLFILCFNYPTFINISLTFSLILSLFSPSLTPSIAVFPLVFVLPSIDNSSFITNTH